MTDDQVEAQQTHKQTHQAEDSGQYNVLLFSERNIHLLICDILCLTNNQDGMYSL